jgi:hypothetical protein
VAQLAAHPLLDDLSDYQVLRIFASDADDPVPIPVKFADLAWGTIQVARHSGGIYTPHPNVITLDHPGLPSLDDPRVPALLAEVQQGVVSGKIVTVSSQLSMGLPGSNFRQIDIASVPRVIALEDLQKLRIGALDNDLHAGRLMFHVRDMLYDLDGVFPGYGHFDLDDASTTFEAHAEIEAKGVTKNTVSIKRDVLGQLSATARLTGNLAPKRGHTLLGTLEATFLRGLFDIRGTLVYKSPTVNGEVTVLVTDADSAWQEVRTRLGDKAPAVTGTADAPHGLVLVGWGSLDFRLSDWLTGEAEVIVDPEGFVTAMGRLAPTKTIHLFGKRKASETPFDFRTPGGVGVKVNVGAKLKVHASIGPGVLGDIVIDG